MKLLYTEMSQDMTTILAKEAAEYASLGKRVFYIAPNSMSFEKERKVLELLPEKASFRITITRFAQLSRYFVLPKEEAKESLDDVGLALLFYRVLSRFSEHDLTVYREFRTDAQFIQQLISLYYELKRSQLSIFDLQGLPSEGKKSDLVKIFEAFELALAEGNFATKSKLMWFSEQIETGVIDTELADVVVIIDGFTRFSGEEEQLVERLASRCHDVVIGSYASQAAYKAVYLTGNLYQAGVEFIQKLAKTYHSKPIYIPNHNKPDSFSKITQILEKQHAFLSDDTVLDDKDKSVIELWDVVNQKEEIEHVAKQIRKRLHDGYRYKDIEVLVGDEESYFLQIGQLFDKYAIPYYIGRGESMAMHPLVHVIESLDRLKRYHFRAEDLINLLKSGLYGSLSQRAIDRFEQYVIFADLKGKKAFSTEWTSNYGNKFDLKELNKMREMVIKPLELFFNQKAQLVTDLLTKWLAFLEEIELTKNLQRLSDEAPALEQEKHEEVFKVFTHILEELATIFEGETLSVTDFISLLHAGMKGATYRIVPATRDVVMIRPYNLVEPHANKIIFAIGLTQANFPKTSKNMTLLSDEERQAVNDYRKDEAQLEIQTKDNLKRNHFVALSLYHSASEQLILSRPQIFNEQENLVSPYLLELERLGIKVVSKGRSEFEATADALGHYRSIWSQLLALQKSDLPKHWDKETETFWLVAARYLRKKLKTEHFEFPKTSDEPVTSALSEKTLHVLYPSTQPLTLSASSLRDFYQNEYAYFLKHVLNLEEMLSIHPDARSHGNFLHRIFERVVKDKSEISFDEKVGKAIRETSGEKTFRLLYEENQESRYTRDLLIAIAKRASVMLEQQISVEIKGEEVSFGGEQYQIDLSNGNKLSVVGKVDRLDHLKETDYFGVVDYKSGKAKFKLKDFFNGLSPQLLTYITAMEKREMNDNVTLGKPFGAMYLHLFDPIVKLSDSKNLDDVAAKARDSIKYQGLFLSDLPKPLGQEYDKTKANQFSQQALSTLLAYNDELYRKAGDKILSGEFLINPYTEDGLSVKGEQYKAITRFEANYHMPYARHLIDLPDDWLKEGTDDEEDRLDGA